MKSLVRLIIVIGIFYFLSANGLVSWPILWKARENGWPLFMGSILIGFIYFLTMVRWWMLIRAHGFQTRLFDAIHMASIGQFFNTTLPGGAVSGDVIKAYSLGASLPGRLAAAFSATILDRVIGLTALVVVASGSVLLASNRQSFPASYHWSVALSGIIFVSFYFYLFLMPERHDFIACAMHLLAKRIRPAHALERVYQSLREVRKYPEPILLALVLSIFGQLVINLGVVELARALEIELSWADALCVVPIGFLVTAIPIAPAGLGTGNLAFLVLLRFVGCDRGADLFSLYALVQLLLSLSGGFFYVYDRSRPLKHIRSEISSKRASM